MTKLAITKTEYFKLPSARIEFLIEDKSWMNQVVAIANCTALDIKEQYGNPSFKYNNDSFIYCWVFEFEGVKFAIFSGVDHGTTIEATDLTNLDTVKSFVERIAYDLKDNTTIKRWLEVLEKIK